MPSYDFVCEGCNHRFTVTLTVSEYEKKSALCPECNSKKLKRTIAPFSVITSKKS